MSSDQDTVFTTGESVHDTEVVAIDARTGAERWSQPDARFLASDDNVTVLVREGTDSTTAIDLYAVDTTNGHPIWDASVDPLLSEEVFDLGEPWSAVAANGRLALSHFCYEG